MTTDNLPRVTYSNIGVDFSPVHDKLDRDIQAFKKTLGRFHANRIGGKADEEGRRYEVRSPIDDRLLVGSFVEASADAVDRAVAAARKAYPKWSGMPWPERVKTLRRAAEILAKRKYDLGIACLIEVGKSRIEAMGESEEAHDLIAYYCDEMETNKGYARDMQRAFPNEATSVQLRPVGVFGVIAPFNFPAALSVGMMTGALLGGNTVVYKPAPQASLTGVLLADALHEAGLPDGAVNLICGEEPGRALADHSDLDGIVFTGSHAVGMEIFRKFAHGAYARPVIVEMGGKNPAYVSAKADLELAAEGVMRSAFGLSGQKCSACSVAYVDRTVHDNFVDLLRTKAAKLKIGNPEQRDVYMGPVIDVEAGVRFDSAVARATEDGTIAAGGKRLTGGLFDHGVYVEPTIVTGLPAEHPQVVDELFLPFLAVRPCDDLAAGIVEGNAVLYGLTAGVYTRDKAELDLFFNRAEAGVLYANRRSGATTGAWPGIQTFCGWKGSGVTNKGGLGPFYVPQFMREQSRTVMDMSARASGTEGYAEDADKLAVSYESLTFAGVQREVLHLVPTAPSRVLDIGAGSGRDAAALAAKGHTVTAMEPTAELRAHGRRLHPSPNIVWVDDSLPELARLRAAGVVFDLVMATAVWMHLDEAQRPVAMRNVAALVAPGGRFTLSLRHGPVPPGRRMFDVSGDETIALARAHGLVPIHRSGRGDMLGRADVTWTFLGFEKTEPT